LRNSALVWFYLYKKRTGQTHTRNPNRHIRGGATVRWFCQLSGLFNGTLLRRQGPCRTHRYQAISVFLKMGVSDLVQKMTGFCEGKARSQAPGYACTPRGRLAVYLNHALGWSLPPCSRSCTVLPQDLVSSGIPKDPSTIEPSVQILNLIFRSTADFNSAEKMPRGPQQNWTSKRRKGDIDFEHKMGEGRFSLRGTNLNQTHEDNGFTSI
jgi:hypothetical protein